MSRQSGFTLVELMVVVAIVGILSTVAAPAYINYVNRAKQGDAVEALMRAKMDQESFWAENGRYAKTIGLLSSFGNTNKAIFLTADTAADGYSVSITNSGTITAKRTINGVDDILTITTALNDRKPTVQTTDALKFSVFKWIFK